MYIKCLFVFCCVWVGMTAQAQIKPTLIYSGAHCVFDIGKGDLFVTCADTTCYELSLDDAQQLEHVAELVLLDNNEFWYVENSIFSHHKDSILFFTGTWRIEGAFYRLDFDSIHKPLAYFKFVDYQAAYLNKPIVSDLCIYYTLPSSGVANFYWTAYHSDMHSYQNQQTVQLGRCKASVPLYLEFPRDADKLHKFFSSPVFDKMCTTLPIIELQPVYRQAIRIIERN